MDNLGTDYGLWGLIILIAIKELWPFFRDKFYPDQMKLRQSKDDRVTVALEGISTAQNTMAQAISALAHEQAITNNKIETTNERISTLTTMNLEHNRINNEAITAMLVRTNTLPQRQARKKNDGQAKGR